MSLQPLVQIDEANAWLAKIDDAVKRSTVVGIVADIQQFYSADPSGVETPFDLAFVCKVLDFGLENALDLFRGIVNEALYWSDELPRLTVRPVEPERDSSKHKRRIIQAENYCALHSDKWTAAVLMSFMIDADLIINAAEPKFRYHPGANQPQPPAAIPAEPLDHLFLVRALDYALRPGGPVRTMIQAHQSGRTKPV